MSQRVVTCGCAVVYLDHKPGEPTIFDKTYKSIKQLFGSKPMSFGTKTTIQRRSRFVKHPVHV